MELKIARHTWVIRWEHLACLVFAIVILASLYSARDGLALKQGPVGRATSAGDIKDLEALLRQGGDANERDNNGETPIFTAIGMHRFDLALVIKHHGADLSVKNDHGETVFDKSNSVSDEEALHWLRENERKVD